MSMVSVKLAKDHTNFIPSIGPVDATQKKDSLASKGGMQTLSLPDASGASKDLQHDSSSAALDGNKVREV